jgi:flagellin
MTLSINTNIASLTAQRNLANTSNDLGITLQRLSSGLRINSAKDDAAGLAISERFTTQIRGLNQAVRNANDGISFAQTAEGALSTVGTSLQRIRELAVQSVNDTNSSSDRSALNNEVQQLIAEVGRVSSSTQFNGQNILDGTLSNLTFQVGANQNQTISVSGVDSRTSQLGARVSTSGSISETNLQAAITANDIVVNGITVDLTGDQTITDVLSSINAVQADTGVQALKATSVSTDAAGLAVNTAGVVTINGAQVTLVASAGAITSNLAAINAVTTQTGVTATEGTTAGQIVLSNSDGSDIVLDNTGTGQLGANAAGETYHAGVTLAGDVSQGAYTAAGTFAVETGSTALGASQTDQTLSNTDVLTGQNANTALLTLDFALQQVTGLRAELGAVQVRFESTITNLSASSENLTAARGRIIDADFAKETANLTKTQILQQAGISVVAQANSVPQLALSLLK